MHLWEVEKNVISRDLRGKYVMLYGKPKSGKTTAACSFPNAVLLAFEKGYNAIGNAYPYNINKWSDFKMALRDLADERTKARFSTVIIDTVSICWDMCEKYICQQAGVQKINDIAWGQGFSSCKKEFEESIRSITKMNYGVVLIAHSASRIEKTAENGDIEVISPDLPKRGAEICNGIVDIIGYIGSEWVDGVQRRWLYTRETPTLFAGSRFKYMKEKIPFGYNYLVDAIAEAIEQEEKIDGATVVDTNTKIISEEKLDFKEVRAHALELWNKIVGTGENANPEAVTAVSKKIEIVMGRRMKLSEFTEDQVELLNLVNLEMEDMI